MTHSPADSVSRLASSDQLPTESHRRPVQMPVKLKAYSRQDDGHRSAYVDFARSRLGAERIGTGGITGHADPVIFLMIEEGFWRYVGTSMLRALRGRRTIGLLFRPLPCVASRALRHRVKYTALRSLRRFRLISTLTIVPLDLDKRFSRIADGSVHDFQLWDLTPEEIATVQVSAGRRTPEETSAPEGTGFSALDLRKAAGDRKIVVSLGLLNRSKGFDFLAHAYATHSALREKVLVAAGGRVEPASAAAGDALRKTGGWLADRFISNAELLQLYAAADVVWCYYEPDYDQASGILGRAMQLGLPVVVRKGSLNHLFCERLDYPHVASDGQDIDEVLDNLPPPLSPEEAERLVERFRVESLSALAAAAGGPIPLDPPPEGKN